MRLLLVADTYPPARISGALQMRDLARSLAAQGHLPVVLTPTNVPGTEGPTEEGDGVQVLRVQTPRTKDVPYWRRLLAEMALPWLLFRGLRRSPWGDDRWDGVVWYSPTIFLGPLVKALKRRLNCPSYLVVRDLFPDWAVDAGVMAKGGAPYRFLKAVERFQYQQADVIGVQSPSNARLVSQDAPRTARIEVLHNWLAAPRSTNGGEPPDLGLLEGRINFVYAGNMGVAQDIDAFVELAHKMRDQSDVGFIFVGRGSEAGRLKADAIGSQNLLVLDEIEPTRLPALFKKCHVGIIALHPAHGTHNIPGKLLTYLHSGLPVLARVNPNNDLVALIRDEKIGLVVAGDEQILLRKHAYRLATEPLLRKRMGKYGKQLAENLFSPRAAAVQVVAALDEARRRSGS